MANGVLFLCLTTEHYIILLIYSSCYSIAYCVKLLEAKLVETTNPSAPFWDGSKKVLLDIHRANAALGSVLSVPVLLINNYYATNHIIVHFVSNNLWTPSTQRNLIQQCYDQYIND